MNIHYQHKEELKSLIAELKTFDKSRGNDIIIRVIEILIDSQETEDKCKGSWSGIGYDVEG